MAVLLGLCNFLTGTYTFSATSYALTDVVQNHYTSGGPAAVDGNGLIIGANSGSFQQPQAIGPLLSTWASLYNASGFTCVLSWSFANFSGNNWITSIDATGGPGVTDLIVNATTSTPNYTIATQDGYTIVQSPLQEPAPGGRENVAWQVGIVNTGISTNGGGGYYAEGPSQVWAPLSENITFFYGSSDCRIQWIGLYDTTVDISWLPSLSTAGTPPPSSVPTGTGPGHRVPPVGGAGTWANRPAAVSVRLKPAPR